jgi:hypothetical protein
VTADERTRVRQAINEHKRHRLERAGVRSAARNEAGERISPITGLTRAETTVYVTGRRQEGATWAQIAGELDLTVSTVRGYQHDPDGAKDRARKTTYRQRCACGNLMDGSNGRTGTPKRCAQCAAAELHDERYWTRDRIISTMRAFNELFGRPPTTTDYTGRFDSQAVHFSETRLREIDEIAASGLRFPLPSVVSREFGSWANAVNAAGMEASPTGRPSHR